jgi:hypothetical protein
MPIESYRDLEVWQLGRKLTKLVYQHSKKFPAEEKFGLSWQIRRAAVSFAVRSGLRRGLRLRGLPDCRRPPHCPRPRCPSAGYVTELPAQGA